MQSKKVGVNFLFVFLLSLTVTSIISTGLSYYFGNSTDKTVNFSESERSNQFDDEEELYLIEDNKIQLVISSKGATISEINIPFHSKDLDTSVLPLSVDKHLLKRNSVFSRFPIKKCFASVNSSIVEVDTKSELYPVLRRNISGNSNYNCLNIVSEYEDLSSLKYELVSLSDKKIVMEAKDNLRKITKTFEISDDISNIINCSIQIDGDCRGFWITSGVLDVEVVSGKPANYIFERHIRNGVSDYKSLSLPSKQNCESMVDLQWIGNTNGFFAVVLEPENFMPRSYKTECISGKELVSRFIDSENKDQFGNSDGYRCMLKMPSKDGFYKIKLFAGPLLETLLKDVDRKIHPGNSIDSPKYNGYLESKGWLSIISAPFSKILSYLLPKLFLLTGSWTLAIILLTLFLRIVLYPFNAWSISSIDKIKRLAPIVATIQETYKNDPNRAKIEIFNLYRQHNINPFSGLIPLFAQMPFLFGMFDVLRSRFELRGAPAIPGWIDNLAAPDVVFSWTTPLPIIGNELHLLPILLGFIMFAQQVITTQGMGQSQKNNFGIFMTVFFVLMFYNFPAGLNIYWMFSIIFALCQQLITKSFKSK